MAVQLQMTYDPLIALVDQLSTEDRQQTDRMANTANEPLKKKGDI